MDTRPNLHPDQAHWEAILAKEGLSPHEFGNVTYCEGALIGTDEILMQRKHATPVQWGSAADWEDTKTVWDRVRYLPSSLRTWMWQHHRLQIPQHVIGEKYGVSQPTVSMALTRATRLLSHVKHMPSYHQAVQDLRACHLTIKDVVRPDGGVPRKVQIRVGAYWLLYMDGWNMVAMGRHMQDSRYNRARERHLKILKVLPEPYATMGRSILASRTYVTSIRDEYIPTLTEQDWGEVDLDLPHSDFLAQAKERLLS